ncbi:MAG: di-trans,poly-cis-decaprenylcistransferase, partial [Marine Group III euryarchaeote CG-Bathy1]
GVIMDGNRRYAAQAGLFSAQGHILGKNSLEKLLDWCMDLDIRIVTVYAFSMENLNRDEKEVDTLMSLFNSSFKEISKDERVHKNKIKIKVIGSPEKLPKKVQNSILEAEEKTKDYSNFQLNIAVAYSGRQEIIHAVKTIVNKAVSGEIQTSDINSSLLSSHLYTGDLPDPDLILRTSGEERISNFLLWQIAYAELYFADVYWPALRKIDFLRAIRSFQLRKRRLGN